MMRSMQALVPPTPYDLCSLVRRMSWSTVSNAALRSSNPSNVTWGRVGCVQNIWEDLKESSFRGVPLSVGWLVVRKEPVHLKVARQLRSNNPFDDLGDECQVRNRTITLDIVWIEIMFLEDRCDDSCLLWFREQTVLKGNVAHDADEREQLI